LSLFEERSFFVVQCDDGESDGSIRQGDHSFNKRLLSGKEVFKKFVFLDFAVFLVPALLQSLGFSKAFLCLSTMFSGEKQGSFSIFESKNLIVDGSEDAFSILVEMNRVNDVFIWGIPCP